MSRKKRLVLMVLGIVIFGLLMGVRQDLPEFWMRVGVAMVAFAIFGLVISEACRIGRERRSGR